MTIKLDRESIAAWWRERPLRERLLLAVVALAGLLALLDASLTAPLQKKLQRARADVASMQAQLAERQRPAAGAALARAQEAALRERLASAQKASSALQQRLADATRLPQTLRAIVGTVGAVKVIELDLSADAEAAAAPPAPGAPRPLHRLPITLKVAGSFDELQRLLQQIEHHADALQWQSLTLDNAGWPAIELTLKAWVWSTEPRWGAS